MINSINSTSSGYLSQLSNNDTVNLLIAAATKTDNSKTVSNVFEASSDSSNSSASTNDLSFLEYMELMKTSKTANSISTEEESSKTAGDISSIDADGDGTISADEYETMISQMGIKNAISADQFYSQYDTDGDGELTAEEYNAKDNNRMPPPPMHSAPQIDTDGDGTLSSDEYETMISQLGIDNALSAEEFFSTYDSNGDGEIDTDELQAMQDSINNLATVLPSEVDTDGDGTLSSDEYETMISQLGIDNALSAEEFYSTYDTNQDGELSADELQAMSETLTNGNLTSNTLKAYETNYQYMFENVENRYLNQVV